MTARWAEINGVGGGYRVGRYREFAVAASLGDLAEVGWYFSGSRTRTRSGTLEAAQRVLPETGVSLTFECLRDHGGRIEDLTLAVMGPITATRIFRPAARTEMTGIRIRPEWCPDLLGLHAGELLNGIVRVPRGRWSDALRDRLSRSENAAEAASLLMSALAGQRQTVKFGATARLVHRALERLRCCELPSSSLRVFAQELGLSPRHLRRVVSEGCGFGIKWFQRVRRLHRAVSAAAGTREHCWSALAVDTGYYDQAHMINEFRALSGVTPMELLAERVVRAS